jgi:hypothetical protein
VLTRKQQIPWNEGDTGYIPGWHCCCGTSWCAVGRRPCRITNRCSVLPQPQSSKADREYRSTDQWEVAAIATTADRRYRNQIGKSPLGTLRANAEDSLSLLCEQARKVPLTMSTSTPTPSTSLVLSWRKLAGWRKNGQRSRTGIQHFNRMISGLLDDGLGSWTGALGSIRVQVGPGPNWTQVEKIIN